MKIKKIKQHWLEIFLATLCIGFLATALITQNIIWGWGFVGTIFAIAITKI